MKRGVLLCGTGLGMSYVANRYPHVRAAVGWTPEIAELAREHNDANVLVLPARFVGDDDSGGDPQDLARHAVRGRPPRAARREDRTAHARRNHTMNDWIDWDRCPPGAALRDRRSRDRAASSSRRSRGRTTASS